MVEETVGQLFDPAGVRAALRGQVGFDAHEAVCALKACHDLQVQAFNDRRPSFLGSIEEAMAEGGELTEDRREVLRAKFDATQEPDEQAVSVAQEAVAAAAGLELSVVAAVVEQFRLNIDEWTPLQAVREFTSGNNPLRTNPLLVTDSGRLMLVHDALTLTAVRENLEQILKATPAWEQYQTPSRQGA
jgi:hypothetical protein